MLEQQQQHQQGTRDWVRPHHKLQVIPIENGTGRLASLASDWALPLGALLAAANPHAAGSTAVSEIGRLSRREARASQCERATTLGRPQGPPPGERHELFTR